MSLTNCEKCNHLISISANICPNCGFESDNKNSGCKFILIAIIIVLLIILGAIIYGFLDFIYDLREGLFPKD